jgi:hypothetical protein
MVFTAEDKYQEALREVEMRQEVFARLVTAGNMSEQLSKRRIAIMQEIADHFKELAKKERLL